MSRIEIHYRERSRYPIRMAGSVVASLLLAIAAFRWWPPPSPDAETAIFDTRAQDLIELQEIVPTRQRQQKPPPRAPVPPVIVPNEVQMPETELELTDELALDDSGESGETEPGTVVQTGSTSARPDAGPRPVRFVEPEYSEEARKRRIRAEVIVEVLVDVGGRVREARVVKRFVLKGSDNDQRESVAAIGYGLETAAVAAAEKWMFRPARENGRIVESWTTLTFSFGL